MANMKDLPSDTAKEPVHGGGLGVRHGITLVLCACLAVNYIIRVNLSVAVVVMTDTSRTDGHPIFNWTPEQKGLLLSSFFIGYLVSNIVSGVIVTKVDNKTLLLLSVSYSTISSFLTPVLVNWGGFAAMFILRTSTGLVQGVMMPVTIGLLSKWIPLNEKARCSSIVLGGPHLGTILSFLGSGFLSGSSGGWPSVFYASGLLSGIWCILWYTFGAVSPDACTRISESERLFINNSLASVKPEPIKKIIPWKLILTNKAFYALTLDMIGHHWGYWILITQIPSYFAHVHKFDTSKNGALSALPFLCLWLSSFPVSVLSDYLVSRKVLSVSATRKTFNTLGQWIPAIALLSLAYTTTAETAVILYTIAVTVISFTFVGFCINPLDIAPNYAGLVTGLANGTSNITSILGPAFVGFVVIPLDNIEGWKLVFLVAAGFFFAGNLFFIIWGSGEPQDFNYVTETKHKEDLEILEKKPLNT